MRCHLCGGDLDGFLGGHFSACPAQRQVEATREQNRLLEEQREAQEAARREARRLRKKVGEQNELLEEASNRAARERRDEDERGRRAARDAEADARSEKDVARRLHQLGLEHRRLLRSIEASPDEGLLAVLSLAERVRMIDPGDVEAEQRGFLTELTANVEDACATASRLMGAEAEPLSQWFSLELERFLLVAAALRRTSGDRDGDLAAKNLHVDSLQELRAGVAQMAERFSALAAAVLRMCPEEPPYLLARLASTDSPTYGMFAQLALTQLAKETAKGIVSEEFVEFVEKLRKEVSAGLASAARSPEDAIGPRPKMFGRAKWDKQLETWLAQQRSDACETLDKYKVLRIAGDYQRGMAESLQLSVDALDAIFSFDRDSARGGIRTDLEARFDRLWKVMWREVTKIRPRAGRREDLEELADMAEHGNDALDEAFSTFRKRPESEPPVAPEDVFEEARDAMEDFFGDEDEE